MAEASNSPASTPERTPAQSRMQILGVLRHLHRPKKYRNLDGSLVIICTQECRGFGGTVQYYPCETAQILNDPDLDALMGDAPIFDPLRFMTSLFDKFGAAQEKS